MERYEETEIKDGNFKHSIDSIKFSERQKTKERNNSFTPHISNNILHKQGKDESHFIRSDEKYANLKTFIMPNELFINFSPQYTSVSEMLSKRDRLQLLSFGHHSTPASPEEMERTKGKQAKNEASSFHSPISEKKLFSYSSGFVRTSKSEDHLQKSSLTTVNIDIEDEMASSLNTLLDTKQEDNMYNNFESLTGSSPVASSKQNHDSIQKLESSDEEELSPTSSETSSPSKISVKLTGIPESESSPEKQSDSSGSEIIPSDSSTTIRKGAGECSEGECTSEQISAISSLDGMTDQSHATDSDVGSPIGSLSPAGEFQQDDWISDFDLSEGVFVSDVPPSKVANKAKQVPSTFELTAYPDVGERAIPQTALQAPIAEKTPSYSSSLSVPKLESEGDGKDLSAGSPTSICSEDTFADVSYHELTESYDEESVAELEEVTRSVSPPTDDESDIESLHSFHYSPKAVDLPSASRLAKRLYNLDGFKKTDVSRHLCKNNEFSRAVAEEYLKFFDFTGDELDTALRKFLSQFCLIGETQERERVLVHFSKRYLDCNPGIFRSQDAVHTLTCALMLLNSDLHGENVCRKMACGEFIENLSDLNDGENFPREILKSLYHSIKSQPLEWATNGEDDKKSNSSGHGAPQNHRQSYIGHNPFLEVPNPNCATEYKKGYVMRKCCIDPSGKKTPLGRRSWKMLYATLRDLVLYLHKDEHGFKKNQLYDSLHNSIRIHHAYAEKAIDYTKKQYVFRLHTADQAVYLFQTSDSKELESWVDTINLVAASLSSPCLPPGVGCQRKFQRPLLPVSHTKLNLREQLQDHETRIVWLEKEYEEHLNKTPERGIKSRFLHEHLEKEAHLLYELNRFRTYAYLLRSRMAQYPELETPMVQTSIGEVEEPIEKYKKSNSPQGSPVRAKSQHLSSSSVEVDTGVVRQEEKNYQ